MSRTLKKPLQRIGYGFIPPEYIPSGQDEYYLRDQQFGNGDHYRLLTAYEIEVLVKNDNQAGDWTDIRVSEQFNPHLVKNCQFYGRIRIGELGSFFLEYHELKLPVGIYNSTIVSCDIGDNVVIKNVDYLAHYIIGSEVILFNINEIHTTNYAKFGNGILKEGEKEENRIWLEVSNENGGRKVLPFDGLLPADAWLWSKYRADKILMSRFEEMTASRHDARRGYYGVIGDRCVIKNTRILKDVKIGTDAYIKGGNKLKNLTINSSAEAPSQIGEGAELVNGILGFGSRAFYGVKAVRFVMGENTTLKYGARLINSILGDNSTISCCEVLNSLIFPAHEQHHNNSFLVAATVQGQSNIAAAATIGSNHNSRGADGEMLAGRGFWPGLTVSLKHNSRFASYCLIARGAYQQELDIPFPFALVVNHEGEDCLNIMPAYWWMYNMYALARNSWKYQNRDRRKHKLQPIVFDFLAPDTVEEIFQSLQLLEQFTAKAYLEKNAQEIAENGSLAPLGKTLLLGDPAKLRDLKILADNIENSKREVRLLKATQAYHAYREMLQYYCIKTLVHYSDVLQAKTWAALKDTLSGSRRGNWSNLGGQLVPEEKVAQLLQRIRDREILSWNSLHRAYGEFSEAYPRYNAAYAFAVLLEFQGLSEEEVTEDKWNDWLREAVQVTHLIARQTRATRQKDYHNPFRKITFDSTAEMEAVHGSIEDDSFIQQMEKEALQFEEKIKELAT